MSLVFAVAGTPLSTPKPGGTVEGLKHAHTLGIRAMEIEWVRQVPHHPERMEEIRNTAASLGMSLTVHAPYFVNLATDDPEKMKASKRRILDALAMAQLAGAWSVCVHPAFYNGTPEQSYERVARATEEMLAFRERLFPDVNLAYETMGKPSQFGTLEEVLRISKQFGLTPCIDPAHLHARYNGRWNSTEEWEALFDHVEKALGSKSLKKLHVHFSGIAYSEKAGERHHLTFKESDARWEDFLLVLKKKDIGGTVVSESPGLEDDTLLLQKTYEAL